MSEEKAIKTENGGNEKMKRIRDILIGKNYDEIQKRIDQVDEHLIKELKDVQEYVNVQIKEFKFRLNEIHKPFEEKIEKIKENNKRSEEKIQSDISALNNELSDFLKDKESEIILLKKQIAELKNEINEKLQLQIGEVKDMIRKELKTLKNEKLNKSLIASALSELALQIGEQNDIVPEQKEKPKQ